ncbi:hypothetical protein Hamer_G023915 [Homarus americanus]|uniref:DDE-1 domain-containing protein n=1 Tax=Homarus americanus TaxID=6706 RepID=A0A8J5K6D7_HOMAM|nr:hypothetical protein Hamer_G023915 [Homarus americanus]
MIAIWKTTLLQSAPLATPPPCRKTLLATPVMTSLNRMCSVKQFWKQFHIRHTVDHMVAAWNKITLATINHAWKPLFPHLSNARSAVQRQADLLEAAVESARSVPTPGFREVDAEQINEMLKENDEEMLDEVTDKSSDEAGEGDAGEELERKITTNKESLILSTCSNLQELVKELSENENERASLVSKVEAITNTFMPRYQRKINERQQSIITLYLTKRRHVSDALQNIDVGEEVEEETQDLPDITIKDFLGFEPGEPGGEESRGGGSNEPAHPQPRISNITQAHQVWANW